MTKVYLCGPINGCTDAECNDWRAYVKGRLPDTVDPMKRDYRGEEKGCYREIVELDKRDVRAVDVVLCNCPGPSWGTGMEIFYAWELGKVGVVVVPKGTSDNISPWLRYHAMKICESFDEAIDWIEANT